MRSSLLIPRLCTILLDCRDTSRMYSQGQNKAARQCEETWCLVAVARKAQVPTASEDFCGDRTKRNQAFAKTQQNRLAKKLLSLRRVLPRERARQALVDSARSLN